MKKKILIALMLTVMSFACILTGCTTEISMQQYISLLNKSIVNTYDIVLTNKDDLSTHGDFTATATEVQKTYNKTDAVWTKIESTEIAKRVGKGANTILQLTTTTTTDDGKNNVNTETTITTYTKIDNAFYILSETRVNQETPAKSIAYTYASEAEFIADIYDVSKEVMESISDLISMSEIIILGSMISDTKIVGNDVEATLEMKSDMNAYNDTSAKIERAVSSYKYEIKDSKFTSATITSAEYVEDVKMTDNSSINSVSYSANIARPALADYQTA